MEGASRIDSVAAEVSSRMSRGFLSPSALLARMSVVDSPSKAATAYQDPNYLPFYFHLGRVVDPASVFCIGAEIGLQVGCLLEGCGNPRSATCLQPPSDSFFPSRLALSNIRSAAGRRFPVSLHSGDLNEFVARAVGGERFDLAMVVVPMPVDLMMDSMDLCWSVLVEDGLMVVDMLDEGRAGPVFADFCRARNLKSAVVKTRYGTGIAGR